MKLLLFILWTGISFAQYIEGKDFASRIYFMGNPSFILEDPEMANNLYALEGNPADLLSYCTYGQRLDLLNLGGYYYNTQWPMSIILFHIRLRYLVKIDNNLGLGLIARQNNLFNFIDFGDETSKNYIFLGNIKIRPLQIGYATSLYKPQYPEMMAIDRLNWQQDFSLLYNFKNMKFGCNRRWLNWWFHQTGEYPHITAFNTSFYSLYSLSFLEWLILYRNYQKRKSEMLSRGGDCFKGRFIIKRRFGELKIKTGISIHYLKKIIDVLLYNDSISVYQWNTIFGVSLESGNIRFVAEPLISRWTEQYGDFTFLYTSFGWTFGGELEVFKRLQLRFGVTNVKETNYWDWLNIELPKSVGANRYTLGFSYNPLRKIYIVGGNSLIYTKKQNDWSISLCPIIHLKWLFD